MSDTLTMEVVERLFMELRQHTDEKGIAITHLVEPLAREGVAAQEADDLAWVGSENGGIFIRQPSPNAAARREPGAEELAGLLEWMGSQANTPEARECDERIHNEAAALLRKQQERIEGLGHDVARQMDIANEHVNEAESLRAELKSAQEREGRCLEALRDVESKIVDYEAGRINWHPDDFLFRVRAALHLPTEEDKL